MRKLVVLFGFLLVVVGLSQIVLHALPVPAVISDARHYDDMAQVFLKEHWIPPAEDSGTGNPLIYPPGYAVFLSGVYAAFGHSYNAVRVWQFLFLALSAYIVFLIANERLQLPWRWSLVAGGMVLVWPYFIMQSLMLYPEVVFTLILLLAIHRMLFFLEQGRAMDLYMASAFLAIGSLIRPNALLLDFWMLGFLFLFQKHFFKERKLSLKEGVIGSVIFVAPLLPWTIYIYTLTHQIIPIASYLPAVLDKANHTKAYLSVAGAPDASTAMASMSLIQAKALNFFLFWNPGGSAVIAQASGHTATMVKIFIALYRGYFLVILATAFFALRRYKRPAIGLLSLVIAYFWILHTILFPYPRYTLPIIPLVITLACFSLHDFFEDGREWKDRFRDARQWGHRCLVRCGWVEDRAKSE